MKMRKAFAHNKQLDPFNFTVVLKISFSVETSIADEEISVEKELVASDISASQRITRNSQ